MAERQPLSQTLRSLPAGIWLLGFVSLLMDVSSELIHSILPLFMVTVLGTSMVTVGLIEGIAEATAAIVKVFSGTFSDYLGKRKWILVTGYGLSALTKPIFPLANTIGWVFTARFLDRIGKGIRGAPRDALIADITPPPLRGAAYGLRQGLDSVGACLGPLLALLLMTLMAENLRTVMWLGAVPAILAVLLLATAVREPEHRQATGKKMTLSAATLRELPLHFWLVALLGSVFTLARFSEAFLVLRAQDSGIGLSHVPLVMVIMNVVYALLAYPAGQISDHRSPFALLLAGLAALIASDVLLALAHSPAPVYAGAVLWGLHLALTQGLLSKLVADTAPAEMRGTAFGLFHLVSGIALLLASLIAGLLWQRYGAFATFAAGAVFASITAAGLLLYRFAVPRNTA